MDAPDDVPPVLPGHGVRLVSGGAIMFAERVRTRVENPYARCVWFDAYGRVQRGAFDLAILDIVPGASEMARKPPSKRLRAAEAALARRELSSAASANKRARMEGDTS